MMRLHSMRGMTLTELMVAMVLGLLISLAVINLYTPLKATVAESKRLESASESLRLVTLHLGRSIRHADAITAITQTQLGLEIKVGPGQETQSCLDNQMTADFSETYRFEAPNLYCDDGSGEQLLMSQIIDLRFSRSGALVSVTLSPSGAPEHLQTTQIDIAMRKPIWQAAVSAP
ncbi:PilW family protein [Shewanella khirikhana]|uniref:Prepilin-type N-terminal cleavage/methylation domain-containing protein n=1 Tax=Shewanella khirikhana TaxID=1965282 RepID=A0ABM7DQI9_9GAMM|nr:prepilin-type N-terminal cleavage/methylation domain-containing protein [Shewanella khirikhana]AZQ11957.1 hypothetical protein STH12_02888 [Shewanella khirikhana]